MRKLTWFLDWFPDLFFIIVSFSNTSYPSQTVHWLWLGKYGCQTSWVCLRTNLWTFVTSVKLRTPFLLCSLRCKFGWKKEGAQLWWTALSSIIPLRSYLGSVYVGDSTSSWVLIARMVFCRELQIHSYNGGFCCFLLLLNFTWSVTC